MPPSRGRNDFDFSFGPAGSAQPARPRPEMDTPFRVLVLADFSARSSRGLTDPDIAARPTLRADIDTLDSLPAALGATVRLAAPDPLDIPIASLDDLHPDALARTLPHLSPLIDLRARLASRDAATSTAAAAEARTLLGLDAPPSPSPAPHTPSSGPAPAAASLLESLLGGKPPGQATPAQATAGPGAKTSPISDLVRRMAQSASSGAAAAATPADPHAPLLLAALDDLLSSHLRAVLHNPAFQRTEAAWRAVHFLITSIATDESLTIDLLDVSKADLAADMRRAATAGNLAASSLAKRIAAAGAGAAPGDDPWSLIVADITLDFTTADAALAAHLAMIASRAGCAIIAAASPAHAGCPSFAVAPDPDSWAPHAPAGDAAAPAAWAAVRQTAEARHLCLALPRFLLRAPYSPASDPCETFPFAELASPADHESLLWANPAYAAAVLIASAWSEDGPDMQLPGAGDITGLPVHTFVHNTQTHAIPSAEAWLTLKAAHALQNAGLTPLLSIKNRDAARFATLQSIATPITPLAGRWTTDPEP